ncbi:hypothetical protein PYCCODRAFT_1441155 [Trametes coccinea BRFM310]|uniref:Uncharacterized protein n=1 Tax=Trametes coccinea (strain BRFM310) TaxID=1353009 RepID=A0A1Y2I7A8_TRAC3|nr:hypothetical protein PYCCODRAFT_1441155 [Trametes coccinea BRFM310]
MALRQGPEPFQWLPHQWPPALLQLGSVRPFAPSPYGTGCQVRLRGPTPYSVISVLHLRSISNSPIPHHHAITHHLRSNN